jgi:hypothetical protein
VGFKQNRRHAELSGFDLIQLRIFQTLLLILFLLTCVRIGWEEVDRLLNHVAPSATEERTISDSGRTHP